MYLHVHVQRFKLETGFQSLFHESPFVEDSDTIINSHISIAYSLQYPPYSDWLTLLRTPILNRTRKTVRLKGGRLPRWWDRTRCDRMLARTTAKAGPDDNRITALAVGTVTK